MPAMTVTPDWQARAGRRKQVAARHRRLERAGFVVLVLAGLALLLGQAKPGPATKTVEAERFVVRDARGKVRAELGLKAGGPGLVLFDEEGRHLARLAMSADGSASLSLYDKAGNGRVVLHVRPDGEPEFDLFNKQGPVRAALPGPTNGPRDSPVRPAAAPAAPVAPEPDARLRAAEGLYRRLCLRCHGADGRGTPGRSRLAGLPDFTDANWQRSRTDPQLAASILDGRSTDMPAFADRVSADQARGLVAYLRSLGPVKVRRLEAAADDFESRLQQLQQQWDELQKQLQELQRTK